MYLLNYEVEFEQFLETPFGVNIVGRKKILRQGDISRDVYLYRDGRWRETAIIVECGIITRSAYYETMQKAEKVLRKFSKSH